MLYGKHLSNYALRSKVPLDLPAAQEAWRGATEANPMVGVWQSFWENPLPSVQVKSLEIVSGMASAAPFLVAITAE